MTSKLRQIRTSSLLWLHCQKPAEPEIEYLRENFNFHPLDLQDCVNAAQRPKVDHYGDYVFLILLFPHYVREERKIVPLEVDFFIGPDFIVTVSDGKTSALDIFFEHCLKSQVLREQYLNTTAPKLLIEILARLQSAIFPMIDHVSQDVDSIDDRIFMNQERRMLRDILMIKRNIVDFRRIMNAHKSTIKKLMRRGQPLYLADETMVYFDNLIDRTKDIWDVLEIQMQTINALQETNDGLISFKLNDAVRVLTAISVSLAPAALLAGLFGINATAMPLVAHPFGFWVVVAMMVTVASSLLLYFKQRDWF